MCVCVVPRTPRPPHDHGVSLPRRFTSEEGDRRSPIKGNLVVVGKATGRQISGPEGRTLGWG